MRLAATISFELMHVAPPLRNFLAALPEVSIDLYLSDGQCQDVETDEISWQPVQTGSNAINHNLAAVTREGSTFEDLMVGRYGAGRAQDGGVYHSYPRN